MSLLLDALKKAALDKQHREQKSHTDDNLDTEAANADVHVLVSHDSSRSTHLSYDEGESREDEENEESLLIREPEGSEADDEAEEQLAFDASEFETFTDEPEPELTLEQPEPVQEAKSEFTYERELALEPRNDEQVKDNWEQRDEIDLLAQEASPDPAVVPTAYAGKAENLALADNPNQEQLERKQAMSRLIARNEEAIKQKKRQRLSLMIVLAVISFCAVGLYYFYLKISLDSQSLYTPAQQAPLSSPVPEENVFSEEPVEESIEEPVVDERVPDGKTVAVQPPATKEAADMTAPESLATVSSNATVKETSAPVSTENLTTQTSARPVKSVAATNKKVAERKSPLAEKPVASANAGVISKSEAPPSRLAVAIETGFQAWQRGEWSEAQQAYQRALSIDPHHRDAVLGAAAVAAQLGNEREALRLYQQRLARAPRDEYALAGLLGLSDLQSEDGAMESELNVLLRDFPEAAHLHYLKGLLHAQRGQWNAAQGYFFDAWKLDANRPDYVFNLAVAMDHLALPIEALQFYKQASVLAQRYASNFSRQALEQRIAQLEAQGNSGSQQK